MPALCCLPTCYCTSRSRQPPWAVLSSPTLTLPPHGSLAPSPPPLLQKCPAPVISSSMGFVSKPHKDAGWKGMSETIAWCTKDVPPGSHYCFALVDGGVLFDLQVRNQTPNPGSQSPIPHAPYPNPHTYPKPKPLYPNPKPSCPNLQTLLPKTQTLVLKLKPSCPDLKYSDPKPQY